MSYSDFRLPDVLAHFSLVSREAPGLFADHPPVRASPHLVEALRVGEPLASAVCNEKVRSELLVAPVLLELKRQRPGAIGLFSGVELSADPGAGLIGTCDFILSLTPEQYFVKAPIVTLVEAKKEDLSPGMGQCVAEMMGARIFNEKAKNAVETVYGVVTSGLAWRFMGLSGSMLTIDMKDYPIDEIDRVLGILTFMTSPQGTP